MLLLTSHCRGVGWYTAGSLQRTSHRTSSAVPSATRANTALSCPCRFPADRLTASVNFFLISVPRRPQSWLSGREDEVYPATAPPALRNPPSEVLFPSWSPKWVQEWGTEDRAEGKGERVPLPVRDPYLPPPVILHTKGPFSPPSPRHWQPGPGAWRLSAPLKQWER